jgi:uncharacterized protein (DUF1501 family)
MDRRYFLKSSGIGLASFGLMAAAPEFLHQFASAQVATKGYGRKKVLVTIFQRGAVDGLNMVVPHGESDYYSLRPTIAVPRPGQTDGAIDLDGHFGLHPSLKPSSSSGRTKSSPSSSRPARPTTRGRTLTRRTIWNRARPATRVRATVGSTV